MCDGAWEVPAHRLALHSHLCVEEEGLEVAGLGDGCRRRRGRLFVSRAEAEACFLVKADVAGDVINESEKGQFGKSKNGFYREKSMNVSNSLGKHLP